MDVVQYYVSCLQKPASPLIWQQASDALPQTSSFLPGISQGIVTSVDAVMLFTSVVGLSLSRTSWLNFDRIS